MSGNLQGGRLIEEFIQRHYATSVELINSAFNAKETNVRLRNFEAAVVAHRALAIFFTEAAKASGAPASVSEVFRKGDELGLKMFQINENEKLSIVSRPTLFGPDGRPIWSGR